MGLSLGSKRTCQFLELLLERRVLYYFSISFCMILLSASLWGLKGWTDLDFTFIVEGGMFTILNRNSKLMLICFFVLFTCSLLVIGGCASGDVENGLSLDTRSGNPEIELETLHITTEELGAILLQRYLDRGYQILSRKPSRLVLMSPVQSGFFSRYYNEITFNFIQFRNKIRVVGQMRRAILPWTGGLSVSKVEQILPNSPAGRKVQKELNKIRDTLVQEGSFEGLIDPGSSSSDTTAENSSTGDES